MRVVKPKKFLGQHFLKDLKVAQDIADTVDVLSLIHILFTSSIAPYGASEDLKTEETLPTPNTPYGISKLVAEKIHQIWQAPVSYTHLDVYKRQSQQIY